MLKMPNWSVFTPAQYFWMLPFAVVLTVPIAALRNWYMME